MKFYKKALLVVITGAALSSSGCQSLLPGKEPLPEDTIEEFEDAYNDMDVDGMLSCMDEKTVKSLTAGMDVAMDLIGAVTGVDLGISASDMIDLAPLMQGFIGNYAADAGFEKVDFQVVETYIKGDRATVYITVAGSGETMAVNMVKDDGKWYMTLGTRTVSKDEADRVIIAGQEEEKAKTKKKGDTDNDSSSILSDLLSGIFDSEKLEDALRQILE